MSLILKQEPANTIATPPAGKSTLFINDNSVMSVKTPAGTVTTFPTVQGSNTQVFFNDDSAINGSANLTFTKTTNTLTLTNGNVVATGVKTDNLYYANGNPWDLQQPAGSNNQLQYNDDGSFGASANLTFNGTSLNTTANLNVTGNAYISGNLTVDGNVVYVNVESLSVEDPLISLGGGPNGTPLTSNNGYDRGLILHNYTSQAVDAFMGWDTSNAEFSFASNVSIAGEVVTINTLGNVRANNIAGTLSTVAQPNITSVGTLTGLLIGATSLQADFPNAKAIISQDNSGQTHSENIGVVGEAVADSGNTSTWGIGVLGEARANGSTKATGVQGGGYVTNSADTGAAVGVRGYSTQTHSGGYNIGVLGNASGSGLGSYAFYVQAGNIGSIETATTWDLVDNATAALTFNSTGKANIFGIQTTDGAEGIYTQGYLNVTGNAAVGGLLTNNLYYANGSPWDLQQAGGSNAQIQFNDDDNFGGSAAFTFNKTSNVVQIGNALSVVGNANIGNIGTGGLITATGNINGANITTGGLVTATGNVTGGNIITGGVVSATGNANVGNLGTTGVFATTLSATGNANVGNIGTGGLITATGNLNAGNIITGGIVSATGNITGGNLTTAGTANVGTLNVTGNVTSALLPDANVTYDLGSDTQRWKDLYLANSTIYLGGANIRANGTAITMSGNTTAANLITAGILSVGGNANIGNIGTGGLVTATGNVTGGNIITGGLITATGNIGGGNINTGGVVSATGNVTGGNLNTLGNVNASIIVAGGTGMYLSAGPSGYINFFTTGGDKASISDTGNITGSNVIANSTVFAVAANVSGNVTAGNVYANTGTIGASLLTGTLTTAAQPNITSVGTLSSLAVTGNVAAGNLTTTGVLSVTGTGVSSIAGNLDMTSNTIINLATPTNANDAATKQYVDDVAQGLNIHDSCQAATPDTLANVTSGTITYDNGTAGLGATLVTTGTFNLIDGVNVQTAGTRILVKNEANAVFNGIYTYTNTTAITRAADFNSVPEVEAGDFTFVTGGTLYDNTGWVQTSSPAGIGGASDLIEFTQFSGAGTYQAGTGLTLTGSTFSVNASQTQITSVGTLTGLGVNGTITGVNITANTGVFTGNGSGLSAIAGANVTGAVAFATTANAVAGANVSGAVSFATTANAVAGANVSGTVSAATTAGTVTTAAQPNITSVGTLTSLAVTGNISAGNVSATTFTGALSGAATSATTAGTVTTAAQPNITSVGTLSSLAVTGNISAGNVSATTFTGALSGAATSATTAGTVTTAAQPNITSVGTLSSLSVTGTVTAGTLSGSHTGSGAGLSSLTGANVTGTVPSATTAGTVTTAAQPNITSVGTLTGLTLSGTLTGAVQIGTGAATHFGTTLTTGANTTAGTVTGNWTLSAGSRLNSTYADLAENYTADADYEPGTILVFGGNEEVTISTESDSFRVAGVVTTNPAYTMNNGCKGEHVATIALQGRVPAKVIGPIFKGDLLVSTGNGYATANNIARAGTIIGKSLENFTGASGIIEVAVGRF